MGFFCFFFTNFVQKIICKACALLLLMIFHLYSERGFVDVKAAQKQNISAKLQENVELRVAIEAYPPPQVRWSKDGNTIKGDKTITTRQEQEIRWDI